MRTLESALRDSARVLRQGASSLPDHPWSSPRRGHVARGVVIGLSAAVLVVVVFAVPGWLTSPSGNDPSTATPAMVVSPQPPVTLADTDPVSPVLEFQTQGLSSDEFHNLTQQALALCMEEHGWTYEPSLQHSPFPEPSTVGELREFRQTHGYGLYTQPEVSSTSSAKRTADRNHDYYMTLDEDQQTQYRTDLNGDIRSEGEAPDGGSCEALANQAIDIPQTDQQLMAELAGLYALTMRSTDYATAEEDWRTCLVDRGYELGSDAYPHTLLDEQWAAEVPADEIADFEITIAIDDFECAFTTTMPITHRLETEVVEELLAKFPKWETRGDLD